MSVIAPTVKTLMQDLNLEEHVALKLRAVLKARNPNELFDLVDRLLYWRNQMLNKPSFRDIKFEAAARVMDSVVGWQMPIVRHRGGAIVHYLGGVDTCDPTLCYSNGRYFVSTLEDLANTGREMTNDEMF